MNLVLSKACCCGLESLPNTKMVLAHHFASRVNAAIQQCSIIRSQALGASLLIKAHIRPHYPDLWPLAYYRVLLLVWTHKRWIGWTHALLILVEHWCFEEFSRCWSHVHKLALIGFLDLVRTVLFSMVGQWSLAFLQLLLTSLDTTNLLNCRPQPWHGCPTAASIRRQAYSAWNNWSVLPCRLDRIHRLCPPFRILGVHQFRVVLIFFEVSCFSFI